MKTQVAVLVISAVACASARADWAYTHWGMTPEQVAERSAGDVKVLSKADRAKDGGYHSEMAARGTFKDGPRVLDVGFMFDSKDGLECVLYNALGDDVDPVKADLIKKYGPGRSSDYGPTHTTTWTKPEKIEITVGNAGHTGNGRCLSGRGGRGLRDADLAPPGRRHRAGLRRRRTSARHQASGDPRDAPRHRPQARHPGAASGGADHD
jgi:hypothetical protein